MQVHLRQKNEKWTIPEIIQTVGGGGLEGIIFRKNPLKGLGLLLYPWKFLIYQNLGRPEQCSYTEYFLV